MLYRNAIAQIAGLALVELCLIIIHGGTTVEWLKVIVACMQCNGRYFHSTILEIRFSHNIKSGLFKTRLKVS